MTDHIPLSAAETAQKDLAAFNVAKEIQRQTEGEWEPSIAQSFAILDAALDALRGVAGARDDVLEAADALAHECDLMLGEEGCVAQDFEEALTTYQHKRGKDHE